LTNILPCDIFYHMKSSQPKLDQKKLAWIQAKVERALRERVERFCFSEDRSISQVVRIALTKFLDSNKVA